jgi:hypothetical protein
MAAPLQAATQMRTRPQSRSQDKIVLQDQGPNPVLAIPSRGKLEMIRNFYGVKASVSLRILKSVFMSLSY